MERFNDSTIQPCNGMMSTYRRTTWREKLADDKGLPKVIAITGKLRKSWGEAACAIPAPREVDALIRRVPKGRVTTINHLRAAIARKHGATIGCPITTGIFAWIAAHAAEEDAAEGRKRITPWWRVLKEGGKLNPKYPGGIEEQAKRLQAEGHEIIAGKGRQRPRLADCEKRLAKGKASARSIQASSRRKWSGGSRAASASPTNHDRESTESNRNRHEHSDELLVPGQSRTG